MGPCRVRGPEGIATPGPIRADSGSPRDDRRPTAVRKHPDQFRLVARRHEDISGICRKERQVEQPLVRRPVGPDETARSTANTTGSF